MVVLRGCHITWLEDAGGCRFFWSRNVFHLSCSARLRIHFDAMVPVFSSTELNKEIGWLIHKRHHRHPNCRYSQPHARVDGILTSQLPSWTTNLPG